MTDPSVTEDILSYPVRISFALFGDDTLFVSPSELHGAAAHVDVPGTVVNAATHGYALAEQHEMIQLMINETLKKQVQMAFRADEVTRALIHYKDRFPGIGISIVHIRRS